MTGLSLTSSYDRTCPTPLTITAQPSKIIYRELDDRLSPSATI